ncbi:hypothetical protein CA265_24375 [Sphingobacteriaceae bacterium GW460-11-11-14-LB5]|nr:hypothetical protein CA265_24375 [Sphingobacteriaceae bacterium GW460-11-11-14-LB5]
MPAAVGFRNRGCTPATIKNEMLFRPFRPRLKQKMRRNLVFCTGVVLQMDLVFPEIRKGLLIEDVKEFLTEI